MLGIGRKRGDMATWREGRQGPKVQSSVGHKNKQATEFILMSVEGL